MTSDIDKYKYYTQGCLNKAMLYVGNVVRTLLKKGNWYRWSFLVTLVLTPTSSRMDSSLSLFTEQHKRKFKWGNFEAISLEAIHPKFTEFVSSLRFLTSLKSCRLLITELTISMMWFPKTEVGNVFSFNRYLANHNRNALAFNCSHSTYNASR